MPARKVSRETIPSERRSVRLDTARQKWFFQSKTIIGAVVAVLPALASITGLNLPAAEIDTIESQLLQLADSLNELVGLGLIIWGRISVDNNLRFLPKLPVSIKIERRED